MQECHDLGEIRENIDRLDREIVGLIAKRSEYVRSAAAFKKSAKDVEAPTRVKEVILKVRKLADEYGASPDIVESVYRKMIGCFIEYEMESLPAPAEKRGCE